MSCNSDSNNSKKNVYNSTEINSNSPLLTPEILWSFGRIGDVSVSPDGNTVLFSVKYFDIQKNTSYNDLYTMETDGSHKKRITHSSKKSQQAVWRPDGKKIAFLRKAENTTQMWEINPDGSELTQITKIEGGISGFNYAPDLSKIFYLKNAKLDKNIHDLHPDLPKANAYLVDDHMYRHWDHWIKDYSHIFITAYGNGIITDGVDIMKGEKWESPLRPFGGIEQVVWMPNSKKLAYVCKKKRGVEYTTSTNSDIYMYNLEFKTTENITKGMMGYDMNPLFSPDGDMMAWESMERDGYESDKNRLFIRHLSHHAQKYFTKDFDQNVGSLSWSKDGKNLYFISNWHGTYEIYRMSVPDGEIEKLTKGIHNFRNVFPATNCLIATKQSMSMPTEIYRVDEETGKAVNISQVNKPVLDKLEMGKIEKRWIKTTDKKDMLAWVIYPPFFDKNKKYPTLLYCQGGPQSTVSQFWSYRWNFQMMSANNYIIVAPNRRGLPGFGQEWNEQISGDYGGQNMKDYLSAIDEMKKEPYVDEDKLGAVGASYGGFSVFWLAGFHNKRFKAFIAHDGIFNLEAKYAETDEIFFPNWDLGGPFWEKDNSIAQRSYSNSPHLFVQNWDTPILVIHGGKDYRIADTQGLQAFNSARLRGIPAQLLYLPDENHWVLTAQNGILWQRTFFSWLDKWLK